MRYVDSVVIGAGPAGLAATRQLVENGQSVVLIENDRVGGTSLHRGCIPSKSMLVSARFLRQLRRSSDFGVPLSEVKGSLAHFITRQRNVVAKSYERELRALDQLGTHLVPGRARFISPKAIEIDQGNHTGEQFEARHFFIATGSLPVAVDVLPFDGKLIWSSEDVFHQVEIPSRLVIVGGGFIPCEMACIFHELGSQITIIERSDHLLSCADPGAGRYLQRHFEHIGMTVYTNNSVVAAQRLENAIHLELAQGQQICADRVLVAVGRRAAVDALHLDTACVEVRDFITINDHLQTTNHSIYAIGDVTGWVLQAHAARAQADIAVRHALGKPAVLDRKSLASCVYSIPEIAFVGDFDADERSPNLVTAQVPFSRIGRAIAMGEADGFVKVVARSSDGKLVGALIIGGPASELIHSLSLAIQAGVTTTHLARIYPPHPTYADAIRLAALEAEQRRTRLSN